MYVSDYGFSASNNYWTTNLSSYGNASNNNWLYLGAFEWTISRVSSKTGSAYYVYNSDGNVRDNGSVYNHSFAIRPCFYLNSDVQYASGSGTESDPIRLVV